MDNLVFIARIRWACLMAWVSLGLPTPVLLLIQTVNDNFGDLTPAVWTWALVSLLPPVLLLLIHTALNRHAARLAPRGVYHLARYATLGYLILVLFTLLAEPFATQGNASMWEHFQRSYSWILPAQGLLLLLYGLIFFRKETLFQPNPEAVRDFAERHAEKWENRQNPLRAQCFQLIADNKLSEVWELLRAHLASNDSRQADLALLQGEHTEWKRQVDLNLIAPDDAQRRLNRIAVGLMGMIENI